MNSQPNSHTHCQAAQVNAQTKAWQRVLCLSHPDKIELKKSSLPSENKKYATAQTDTTKTMKRSVDNGLQGRRTEHQPVTAVAVAQLHFKKIKQPIGRVYSLDIFLNYIFTVEKLDGL